MKHALLIRLRPLGPWRYGAEDGSPDSLDTLYRSDRLFSAVTIAMRRLGLLDEWLDATARAERPAVTFSSLFPFQSDTLFAIPPSTLWPPPASAVTTPSPVFLTKIRWKMARFVPLAVIDSLLTGESILADQWLPDPESACLLRRDRPSSSPLRAVTRSSAPVDRREGVSHHTNSLACVEFESGAGLWTLAAFGDSTDESIWSERVKAAFRLLADSGFGGRRSAGWGQAQTPEFQPGEWPNIILPKVSRALRNGYSTSNGNGNASLYWLLSLYVPAPADQIDWASGDYHLAVRSGRVESSVSPGVDKKSLQMVDEGSVLAAAIAPIGSAVDVAPDGFAHPVFRSGLALSVELPVVAALPAPDEFIPQQVEEPSSEEAIETRPCQEEAPQSQTEQHDDNAFVESEVLSVPAPPPTDVEPPEPDLERQNPVEPPREPEHEL